jgi:AcrR family transcriptional regulator
MQDGRIGARRRRPRNPLQFSQQAASRADIMSAMRRLLEETSYAAISVSDIARHAKVSRVTFYRHFPSKAALVREIFADVLNGARRSHLELAKESEPSQVWLEHWMRRSLKFFRRHRHVLLLLGEAMVADPLLRQAMQELRDSLFVALGQSMPAYRATTHPSMAGRQIRLHAVLLHAQYEAFQVLVVRDRSIRAEQAIPVMARLYLQFFADAARLIGTDPELQASCRPDGRRRPALEFCL